MDPNEKLKEIRGLAQAIRDCKGRSDAPTWAVLEAAYALSDATDHMDAWLTRGGFKPKAWDK